MEGDRNTTYFHKKASQRQMRITIDILKDDNGNEVTNFAEIENIILQYFQNIYTSHNSYSLLQEGVIEKVILAM